MFRTVLPRTAVVSLDAVAALAVISAASAVGAAATPAAVHKSAVHKSAARSFIVHPNDRRLKYVGHWAVSSSAATTVNTASRLSFTFTGTRVTATFDEAKVLLKPQIYVTVDGHSKVVTLDKPVQIPIVMVMR